MKHIFSGAGWGLGIAAILLIPIILIFALPAAIGIGLDIFDYAGEMPVALALCGPVVLVLLGRVVRRAPLRQALAALAPSRPHFGQPARLS